MKGYLEDGLRIFKCLLVTTIFMMIEAGILVGGVGLPVWIAKATDNDLWLILLAPSFVLGLTLMYVLFEIFGDLFNKIIGED